jgi:hypothetical protein
VEVVTWADQEGIADPSSRLMNQLGILFLSKGLYSQAEPLMRRALAIDEASFGNDHPNVAIRLNNLAQLLQATNRGRWLELSWSRVAVRGPADKEQVDEHCRTKYPTGGNAGPPTIGRNRSLASGPGVIVGRADCNAENLAPIIDSTHPIVGNKRRRFPGTESSLNMIGHKIGIISLHIAKIPFIWKLTAVNKRLAAKYTTLHLVFTARKAERPKHFRIRMRKWPVTEDERTGLAMPCD